MNGNEKKKMLRAELGKLGVVAKATLSVADTEALAIENGIDIEAVYAPTEEKVAIVPVEGNMAITEDGDVTETEEVIVEAIKPVGKVVKTSKPKRTKYRYVGYSKHICRLTNDKGESEIVKIEEGQDVDLLPSEVETMVNPPQLTAKWFKID